MQRVFLVIDDYNELIYLQTLLKKLGFDVEGLQNPKKYADLSLGFNPQILIATARGKVVDGVALSASIRKRNGVPKVVLLKSAETNIEKDELEPAGVDYVIDSPINPKSLIILLASIGSTDERSLLDKFAKMKGVGIDAHDSHIHVKYDENGQPVEDIAKVKRNLAELTQPRTEPQFPIAREEQKEVIRSKIETRVTPATDPARRERFQKWNKEIGPLPKKNFDRERIIGFNKKIRSAPPPDDIDDIEAERKEFVKKLFAKK